MHGRNQRLFALAPHEPAEPAALGGEQRILAGGDHLEVGTRAKHRPIASEHARPEVVVALELIQRRFHALRERVVDGVARVGSVEPNEQHMAIALGEYRGLGGLGHR